MRLYGSIDKNLRILAQSSKKSTFPHEYIAIVGDSIAVGAGDWLEEVRKNSFLGSPSYSPAHLINEKTGIDVISFGQGGVGSFGGIWKDPITKNIKYVMFSTEGKFKGSCDLQKYEKARKLNKYLKQMHRK